MKIELDLDTKEIQSLIMSIKFAINNLYNQCSYLDNKDELEFDIETLNKLRQELSDNIDV